LIAVEVDLSSFESLNGLTDVKLELRDSSSTVVGAITMPSVDANKRTSLESYVPGTGLPVGNYKLKVILEGMGNWREFDLAAQTPEPAYATWKNNDYGTQDIVLTAANFTPMEVTGTTIKTVLREHAVNGVGLFDQVNVKAPDGHGGTIDTDLLANPMRLEATVNSAASAISANQSAVTYTSPTRTTTSATWSAGNLLGTTGNSMYYDGAMTSTITLAPNTGQTSVTVNKLDLIIPLNNTAGVMRLLHTVPDYLRQSYAGPLATTTSNTEPIWKSTDQATTPDSPAMVKTIGAGPIPIRHHARRYGAQPTVNWNCVYTLFQALPPLPSHGT